MTPARGLCLVRPAETHETIAGGTIILPQSVREGISQYQCEVVAVGRPAICEDEDCERPHEWVIRPKDNMLMPTEDMHPIPAILVPGAWVLVKPRSFIAASETESLYFIRQDDVLGVFRQD